MEQRIMEVLRRMQPVLEDEELRELKNVLHMVFSGCDVAQKTEVQCVDDSWRIDLEDYLMSKALEGKSVDTVNRYRYELTRLLSYINKPVADITDGDISSYLRAYKNIRAVKNSTLKGVRAVYSSFFVWLRDRDRVRRNPMVLVESIKVEKRVKRPFTILSAHYSLLRYGEAEASGECEIDGHYLDVKISPQNKACYVLEITYVVGDSTRKARIEVEVI